MRKRPPHQLPDEKREKFEQGLKLEWVSIFFLFTITLAIYFTMGSSQAMKAAWVEDALSMLPPIAILLAARYRDRDPSESFPYGYHRVIHVAFLATALILFVLGAYILYDSIMSLVQMHHPTIGTMVVFGHQVWAGWIMIAALVYSVIPPFVLGRMKLPIAKETHDKALKADADINKADWLTGGSAILGIVGIGFGLWWADSVAAIIISADIVKDGIDNLVRVVGDLMDQRPTGVEEGEPLGLVDEIAAALVELDWVRAADARLRETGHLVRGEVYVVPEGDAASLDQLGEARRLATSLDWRLHDLAVVAVEELEAETGEG
ncbi:MAG: cation transporter [Gemmatimonadota bacterium]|nr:cation transporter [Gemmatimonadota bacterium]